MLSYREQSDPRRQKGLKYTRRQKYSKGLEFKTQASSWSKHLKAKGTISLGSSHTLILCRFNGACAGDLPKGSYTLKLSGYICTPEKSIPVLYWFNGYSFPRHVMEIIVRSWHALFLRNLGSCCSLKRTQVKRLKRPWRQNHWECFGHKFLAFLKHLCWSIRVQAT